MAVLAQLRGDLDARPAVDPGLSGGLREWLEDASLSVGSPFYEVNPLRLNARALCASPEFGQPGSGSPKPGWPEPASGASPLALCRSALVRALFRQQVMTGTIGDPTLDALDGLDAEGRSGGILRLVGGLTAEERRVLEAEVAAHAAVIQGHWARLSPGWLPRTNELLAVPFAGGQVVVSVRIELIVGTASRHVASTCLVMVSAGPPRPEDRRLRHLAALLETIRSGAPPFRTATFYSASGELAAEDVTERSLTSTLAWTIEGIECQATRATTPPESL